MSSCSHKKKRSKQIKKLMQRGLYDPEKGDSFELFVASGGLTYCLYKESERILGNTFGMCVLQVSYISFKLIVFCCYAFWAVFLFPFSKIKQFFHHLSL